MGENVYEMHAETNAKKIVMKKYRKSSVKLHIEKKNIHKKCGTPTHRQHIFRRCARLVNSRLLLFLLAECV